MKTILLLICLSISTLGNTSNCSITSIKNDVLQEEVSERGWSFENYDRLCNELMKHKLGLLIKQVSQITPYQTSAATVVQAYPLEIQKKYKTVIPSGNSYNTIIYNSERTTSAEREAQYKNANYNLNELIKSGTLEDMKNDIENIRKVFK